MRPAAAVDARKKKLLSQTALDYLRRLKNPEVKFRFDIVEVLLVDGDVREIRHLPNTFALSRPYRYA
jgi:Holliday junction resolvase-like predicted endonuclease